MEQDNSRKTNIVDWAMTNHRVVILIVCCLIAFGMYSLGKMNKNEFPDFTIRQGVVVAVCPGMTARETEEQVTKKLEDYIFSYKEVRKEKTKSVSRHGMSIIQIELNADFNDKDLFWSKFKHGIEAFKSTLPNGVVAVVVNDDFGDTSAVLLSMESTDKSYRELSDLMDDLQDRLRTVEAIGRMKVLGMAKEQVSVYIDNARLSHYGIPFETLALTLYTKGFTTTAGTLRQDGYNSPVRVARSMNVEADVENLIVYSSPTGEMVRMRDIGDVRREYAPLKSMVTTNGKKALVLSVEMKQGRSITEMGSHINKILSSFEETMPKDVSLTKITDQPKVVGDSVTNFLKELLIAVVAVMIVVMLLLPFRVAAIASSAIPITIFTSLGLFYIFKIELNTVTLAALIATLGMIVDDTIVIIDGYIEGINAGRPRAESAVKSARHFFMSILTATLSISITFFPFLLTIKGTLRDFLLAFPYAITIVLLVSLVVAELVIPFFLYFFVRKPAAKEKDGEQTALRAFDNWLQTGYNRLIDVCFKHPYATLATGVCSVIIGIVLMQFIPIRLMPVADRNQFALEIYLPTGTPLARTAAVADSIENILHGDERVTSISSFKGMASPRFQMTYAPQFGDESFAQFVVNTKSNKATEEVLDKFWTLHDMFPDAYLRFKQLAYGIEENPIEVRLAGFDYEALRAAADTITALMRRDSKLWLVRPDTNEPLMATLVSLDEDKAGRLGVSNAGVEMTLASRYMSDGIHVGTLWDGDYDIDVCMKSTNADSATVNALNEEMIPVMGGLRSVPLRTFATVSSDYEDGQIPHRNGIPAITVKAEVVRGENVLAETSRLQKQIAATALPEGVSVTYGGELENTNENLPNMVAALGISVMIIFFILLGHFKCINIPLLLLVGLSLTLFGTVASVFLQGTDFGITSFLGVISLMGILVRNTIIMFDYANELLREGSMPVREAVLQSAKRRMHPIFLTSIAASMGVIPMILGGSGLWRPMGAIICYGTLITMVFILTVLPIAYWKILKHD
ncbi:MAG: efflux RND transporter permease subunit [Prevotella sp.]|nr:efflux RND transporter permease subunit [Prevotella sp.]